MNDLIVIGGGAAGVFAAIAAKEAHPEAKVILLEKTATLLAKVRISGGGRCNVTHACFEQKELIKNYPRGEKELLGPFHRFFTEDTIAWFESRGVKLKTEKDGRMFPVTDSSQTIIDCLLGEAARLGVEIRKQSRVSRIEKCDEGFVIDGDLKTKNLLLATGSAKQGYTWAKELGHTIIDPIPSLFTFHSPTSQLLELSGISMQDVEVQLEGFKKKVRGPLLITHFGFSGPAIIKLSAWAARFLHERDYKAKLIINWLPELKQHEIVLDDVEKLFAKALWRTLSDHPNLPVRLHKDTYEIDGKTTFKKEFVTCGGVHLKEINFKTMESRVCPGLYFAGEILNIDGVTGGFNFQNAWTSAYIAANSLELNPLADVK